MTKERIISFNLDTSDYSFVEFKHVPVTGTIYHKFYHKDRNNAFCRLEYTDIEALEEINDMLINLEGITGIESILNLDLLNIKLLDDVKRRVL